MYKFLNLIVASIVAVSLVGCISPKSFIDPSIPKLSYDSVTKRAEPLKLKLNVQFQRNGQPFPRADSTLRDKTERILGATGVIVPSKEQADGSISVVVNNIADVGAAAAKGFGTGLTFGLAGSTVMDAYEMNISITVNGKTVQRSAIKHALFTAIGNVNLPPGVEVAAPDVAFERVLEQMLLRALQDMQNAGELTKWILPIQGATRNDSYSTELFVQLTGT